MERLEKKKVRLNLIHILDTKCKGCMMRGDRDAHNYCIKHCEVSMELQSLSASLINTTDIKGTRWSEEEELYLAKHLGHYSVEQIANQLNRSPQSVISKIQRTGKKKQGIC